MIEPGSVVRLKGGHMFEASPGVPCFDGKYLPVEQGTMALIVFAGPCDCGGCHRRKRYKVLMDGRILYAQRHNFRMMGPSWMKGEP